MSDRHDPTPAALYARVSSDRQDVDLSVAAQLRALRDHARKNDYMVVREFVDEAESGRIADRPQFRRMIDEASRPQAPFREILGWKFSRFTRKREHAVAFKSLLRRKGVWVVSITEHADDTPTGKLMEAIIESVDEFYSENLAQEVIRGMREAASRGFWVGSTIPYGYSKVMVKDGAKKRPTLEPDPDTSPVIKRIFDLAEAGKGMLNTTRTLNGEGIASPTGKLWSKNGVHYILKNEVYTGAMVWGNTAKDKAEPVRVEKAFSAIVSKAQFRRVAKLMRSRAPKVANPRRVSSSYLLSGLVKCHRCNRALSGQDAKSGQFAYYVCQSLIKRGSGACDSPRLNARRFEELVVGKIDDRQSIRKIAVLVGGGLKPLRISDKAEAPQGPLPRHESTRNRLPGLAEFAGRCLVGFQQSGLHLLNVGRSYYSDFSRESLCVSRGQLPVWFAAPGVGLPTVWNSPIASGTRAKLIPSRACPSSQSTSATSAPSAVQMPNSSSTSVTVMVTSNLSSLVPSEATTVTS